MLDPKLLRQEFDSVKERLAARGLPEDFDDWPKLDEQRRKLILEVEEIRATKNRLGPDIAVGKKEGRDVSALISDLKASGEREKELDKELQQVEADLLNIELLLPNLPQEDVPVGADETANREEKVWGEKRSFDFEPKAHWDIGEGLGILDFEAAAKISGARFVIYKGAGALLERALINFMIDRHVENGYLEVMPPLLVRSETVMGSGQLPKFEADLFKTDGEQPLYLIPTSEVPLCNMHVGEILPSDELPLSYVAFTPCFRSEAGSHGRDVRGLIRLHQFNKVELVKICTAKQAAEEHEKLTRDAESVLEALNLPYRRLTLSTGDMGMAASKTYDLEVWLPGADAYREISSCSTTSDFQGRRTKTRHRASKSEKPALVHMLNGSGLAVGRTLVAILENYQQADGSVEIPDVLRPYMRGKGKIEVPSK
ncbi:serine--tRNA ligase [bacterium J17]|nr:serine--tRNA ligase [bacterium J17]